MKKSQAPHPSISSALLFCIGMVTIGAAGVAYSLSANRDAFKEREAAAAERQSTALRYQRLRDDDARIHATAKAFQTTLSAQPGDDSRGLDWMALFGGIQQRLQLVDVRYEQGAPQTLAASPSESLALVSFPIFLRLKLLHEEDLHRFLDELRSQSSSLVHIKSCHVARSRSVAAAYQPAAQLEAECRIDSIELHNSQPGVAKP